MIVKYLAGNNGMDCSLCVNQIIMITNIIIIIVVVVVVVCQAEPGDDNRDADDGLGSGVQVVASHCHLSAAAAARHTPFIHNII